MEMESSRRSTFDRAREPGLKKPRLSDDAVVIGDRERPYSRDPRLGGGGGQALSSRIRPAERERDEKEETARPSLSYQDLMSQYKTALAELTFNSKPIITNLTIIAGENQHAAKGIASIICSNILEVPSDQKLPSLYLLDSIVKNIGKDYIKYFAARLPEVFCKAYKQVDSAVHPGMRHLFGTWKGVFPSAPLQIIEKDLGFPPAINGSSGATTSKPESQTTQRPSHSIHVNPKYLEARQRLQQSSKAKDINIDDTSGVVTTVDDAERYDRPATVPSTRQWTELPLKLPSIQRPRKEQLNDLIHEKKAYRDVRDRDFSPELPRKPSDLVVGRINEQIKERDGLDKPYYGTGGAASEILTSRRNDSDVDHAYGTYRPSGSAITDRHLPLPHLNDTNKSIWPAPKNWKNSEEYNWDDVNSRLSDYGGANSTVKGGWNKDDVDNSTSSQGGKWMPENLESQWNPSDTFSRHRKTPGGEERAPLFRDAEEHLPQPRIKQESDSRMNIETTGDPFSFGRAASGHHASSVWPPREPPSSMVGLNHTSSRVSGQSEGQLIPRSSAFSTSSLPRPGPLPGPIGMFGQQRQHQPLQPPSPSAQSPPSYVPIPPQRLQSSSELDHFQPNYFSQTGQKPMNRAPQSLAMQDSFPLLPSVNSQPTDSSLTQMRHHVPFTQTSQPSIQTEKPPLSHGSHQTQAFSGTSLSSNPALGQSSTSNLLAAIMKSGLLSKNPPNSFQSPNVPPPLPTGPPPIQALSSSAPSVPPSSLSFPTSHGNTPSLMPPPVRAVLPPLPPGPPPASSLVSLTSQTSNTAGATVGPLSSLLNSLVAKGILSSPATSTALAPVPLIPETLIPPSSSKERDISESSAPTITVDFDNLVGIDFKPEVLREFHPLVIKTLFDELRHQCNICGLRFRLEEQLHNHLDWHASKSDADSLEGVSRKWFADKTNWVAGNVGQSPSGQEEELRGGNECEESMVTADESQCICALCGEPFEDLYSMERDEWMYKGTVYLSSTSMEPGPIVHTKCISNPVDEMEVAEQNKVGWTDS